MKISEKKAYSFICLDLDRFKSYNDHYGFERGNSVILFTARLLKKILIKYGKEDDFLGHIGGDDYIIITASSCEEIICNKVFRYFDRLIKTCYDPCDRKNGFVPGHDRNCQEFECPIVSILCAQYQKRRHSLKVMARVFPAVISPGIAESNHH